MGGFGSYAMTVNKTTIYPDFEDLNQTVDKLNDRLREEPLPGGSIHPAKNVQMFQFVVNLRQIRVLTL